MVLELLLLKQAVLYVGSSRVGFSLFVLEGALESASGGLTMVGPTPRRLLFASSASLIFVV